MKQVKHTLLLILLGLSFCSVAQQQMPEKVDELSKKMLAAYNTSDVGVFLAQFAKKPRESAGDKLLTLKFLKKAKRFQGKDYQFTLDSDLSGYRKFNYPMKTKYYPKIDKFYGVYYSYLEPDAEGRLIKYYAILKYINDEGDWYLIN